MSEQLRSRALGLSYITVGYNVVEGIVSLVAGAMSGSAALLGFGLDSFVESLSGGVMIWRFSAHAGSSEALVEAREKRAVSLVGYAFLVFAAFVLFESLLKLIQQEPPSPSILGMAIAVVSLLAMPALYVLKRRTAQSIRSRSFLADARQTLACMFLSVALLVGLGLNYLWGLWWADPAAGLLIAAFLFQEGRETLRDKKLCTCCC